MATNRYFDNIHNENEQELIEGMIIESIQIFGENVYYVKRNLNSEDKIYGEDDTSSYDHAFLIEMYVDSIDGFGGQGSFMSKFGLEIRDQITFVVAKRVFDEEIGSQISLLRPNEGDLVYFPLNNKCFQIKFVENKSTFYQLGRLYTYVLTCELFEYSGETFNTGIDAIDSIQENLTLNEYDYALADSGNVLIATELGEMLVDETYNIQQIDPDADNISIQTESDNIMDWSETDPFSQTGTY
jgi:hypothetical protein